MKSKFNLKFCRSILRLFDRESYDFYGNCWTSFSESSAKYLGVLSLKTRSSERVMPRHSAIARNVVSLMSFCAVVIFDKNGVKYHFRSKSFENQKYWVSSGPLNNETFAYDIANGKV